MCQTGTVKRPSCKWKGQTDADDNLQEARVARLAECHRQQKAGYCQDAMPKTTLLDVTDNKSSLKSNKKTVIYNISSPALKYWHDELTSKEESTRDLYEENFAEFLQFANKNADELIIQRQQDLLSKDLKIQRRIESQFLAFIAEKKKEGYAIATLQIIYASIRSFFEIHYFPLRMRRGDYPKGDSEGVKRATKETILQVLQNEKAKNRRTANPAILFLKDSGLRISDARRLNCGFFLEAIEKNPSTELIQINVITQKTKLLAKTFIGKEAIKRLKSTSKHADKVQEE